MKRVLLALAFFLPFIAFAQSSIPVLDQFTSTTSPSAAITQRTFGKAIKITGLTTGDCLTLDSNSLLTTTSCGTGGGGGITGIKGEFSTTQTGSTQTLSTSTSAYQGLTPNLTITSASNKHTFTFSLSGTLGVAGGGTGQATFPSSQLHYGNGTNAFSSVATTTLTASSPLSFSNPVAKVGGSNSVLTIDTSGAWSGLAGTATALAANGTNCSAGNYPLGVDASGNVESCTAANSGTVTSIATTYPLTGGTITTSGTIALAFGTTTSNTWAGTQTFTNAPILSSLTGLLKGNGASAVTVAANGTDYSLITALDCTGTGHLLKVTAAGVFTCSADSGGGGGSGNVATSSTEVQGNLSYWTTSGGTPAKLGTVATTSLTASGVVSLSNPISVIGGSASAITITGGTNSQVLAWANGVPTWVATTTLANISGTLGIASGGTGQTTQQAALNALSPTPTRAGDVIYYNGANWTNFAGNNSGTQCLSETSSGVPGWSACSGGGGGGSFPFSADSNYGQLVYATTTPTLWFKSGVYASSTSQFETINLANALTVANGGTGKNTFTSSQLLYGNGTNGLSSVATSTLTASSPLTGSFTVVGSGGSVGCQTASGSQPGCLSSADWTTFNGKGSGTVTSISLGGGLDGASPITSAGTITAQVGTSTVPALGSLAYWTGIGTPSTLGSVATSSISVGATLSVSGGSLGSQIGGSNVTFGIDLSHANTWTGQQTFNTTAPIFGTLNGLVQGNGASTATGIGGTAGQFPYYNGTNTLLATSTIFLATTGKVGIGTTSPGFLLDLFSAATTSVRFDTNSSTKGACLTMKDYSGGGYTYIWSKAGQIFTSTRSCN